MENGQIRNVIVIGGAPAGYTAALYLSRALLKPLVLAGEQAGGQLMWTTEVENFPGFPDGIMGPELMVKMRDQAEKFGAEIKDENMTKVDLSGEIKKIWVGEIEYQAKTVIIATGAKSRMLQIGEEKYWGKGLSVCAVCDAAFFKNKRAMVVGGGDAAMEDALALAKFALSVDIIHRQDTFRASKIMQERVKANNKINIIWGSEVVGVTGESKLETVKFKNIKSEKIQEIGMDGLFLAIGHVPTTELFEGILDLDERKYLKTKQLFGSDYPTQTSRVGVFGAGDVVDHKYRQAITAAGMGCMAALDAEKFLERGVE